MPASTLRVDESTFRACIEKYAVEQCLRRRIPRADVDDVVQEVWTEILASLASFRADKGDFDIWTRAIAWRVVRKHARNSQRYAKRFAAYQPDIDEHPASDPSPERYAQREQAHCLVSVAAEEVSSRQMAVFVLHAVDGMTHVEIAEELNVSESTSQKCYQRTRDHLARCLRGKVLSAMPPDVIGCHESSTVRHSRWNERSHYVVQVAAVIMFLLLFQPSNAMQQERVSMTGEIRTEASTQNAVMYREDKQLVVHDEPMVRVEAPNVKPESVSLPSVRAVSGPAKVGDKRSHLQDLAPIPPFKPTPRSDDHPLLGR